MGPIAGVPLVEETIRVTEEPARPPWAPARFSAAARHMLKGRPYPPSAPLIQFYNSLWQAPQGTKLPTIAGLEEVLDAAPERNTDWIAACSLIEHERRLSKK